MKKLLKELNHPDDSIRRNAAQALSEGDDRAIYPLIRALQDENFGVQDAAMSSLISIGTEVVAYMVVPLLREESLLRNTALIILRELGRVSVPLLYPLLKDKDSDIRKFALDLLGEIKEDVLSEKIVQLIDDENVNVRAAAVKAIGEVMYKEALFSVIKALGEDEWVAFSALDTLGRFKEEASVGPIAELLSSESEALRHAALETLGKIGSEKATEAIARHISSAQGEEKSAAIKSLVQIGITPSISEVADVLVEMFQSSDDWEEKLIALKGIVDLKETGAVESIIDVAGSLDRSLPEDEERLLIIQHYMNDESFADGFIRILENPLGRFRGKVIAAEMLGKLKYEKAVPVLVKLLDKSLRDVRRACIWALGQMDTEEARKSLIDALVDHDSTLRKVAVISLGRLRDRGSFDVILKRLDDEEYNDVVEDNVKALLMIDPEGLFSRLNQLSDNVKKAIGRFTNDLDILLSLSMGDVLDVRLAAIAKLGGIDDERALERLKDALKDVDAQVRRTAVMALSGARCCYEEIQSLFEDEDMWVRLHAVRALGESRRSEMIESLRRMLKDDEVPVSLAAVEAIGMIGGEEASNVLKSLLNHRNWTIREAAGRSLDRL
jgi:HEAT repeat protein